MHPNSSYSSQQRKEKLYPPRLASTVFCITKTKTTRAFSIWKLRKVFKSYFTAVFHGLRNLLNLEASFHIGIKQVFLLRNKTNASFPSSDKKERRTGERRLDWVFLHPRASALKKLIKPFSVIVFLWGEKACERVRSIVMIL